MIRAYEMPFGREQILGPKKHVLVGYGCHLANILNDLCIAAIQTVATISVPTC